jgi:RNA-directed DNA polymerase
MVVKIAFEPCLEPHFLPDSYGYRPNKSARDAIGVTRQRCWQYRWVLEFDIKAMFDNIDHKLLMKAVNKHTDCKWIKLYISRWLTSLEQHPDATLIKKTKGVMQGGVISPLLSNLYLHYVFDVWMTKQHPQMPWCRYADDGLVHCNTLYQAQKLQAALAERFKACGLMLHPDKTKIVLCKKERHNQDYPITQFDFLGYTFRSRWVKRSRDNGMFLSFTPAVSNRSLHSMRSRIRNQRYRRKSDKSIEDIAKEMNPVLRGWMNYFGAFNRACLNPILRYFNATLLGWARRKFKTLKSIRRAGNYLKKICEQRPSLFVHWKVSKPGMIV